MMFISDFSRRGSVLLGLALGDAMGAPFEGGPPRAMKVMKMTGGGRSGFLSGTVTDDTIQASAVALSLVSCRGFNPGDMAARLVKGYLMAPRFFGPTSGRVFSLIRHGADPYAAAYQVHLANKGSRTNGSVMRGAPIGVYFSGPDLDAVSLLASRLTHYDPVAGACSAWLNRMVSALIRGADKMTAFQKARAMCRSPEVAAVVGRYWRYIPYPTLDAVATTHAAVTCFMKSDTFEDAVCSAVSLGGDTDTVGACCGALAGAHYGMEEIPLRWLSQLADRDRLTSLAGRLAAEGW